MNSCYDGAICKNLDCPNYLTWKVKLESLIITYGLDQFSCRNIVIPSQFLKGMYVVNFEYKSWNIIDNLLKS